MTIEEVLRIFDEQRASAILRTENKAMARPAMDAAVRGGFRIIEFTLTIPNAMELIREYTNQDGLLVGAGTVLSVEQAREAVDAGARFLVSPVVDEIVIDEANRMEVAMMPGTHTPTEMHRAYVAGAPMQKLFPAPGIGPSYVKACLGPMPFLKIVPTNGVHLNNAASYIKAGAFAVGFVTPLFDPNFMQNGDFDRIEQRAVDLLKVVHERPKRGTQYSM